jgi:cytochrome c556
MIRFVQALALAATLLLCAGHISFAQPAPAENVKQRRDAMEKLWPDYYRDVSRSLKTDKPDLALVAAKSAQAIEALNRLAALFPPGTGRDVVPATRAKPEVWTQRAAFEAGLKAMVDTTRALGDAAKSGDVEKVKAQWQAVTKACTGCHGGPDKSGGKFRFEKE